MDTIDHGTVRTKFVKFIGLCQQFKSVTTIRGIFFSAHSEVVGPRLTKIVKYNTYDDLCLV